MSDIISFFLSKEKCKMSSCQVETSLFTRKIFLTERWKLYQYRRLVSFILSYRLYFSRLTRDSILNNRNYGVVKKREEVWREDLEIWKMVIALGESGGRMVVERALRAWRTSVGSRTRKEASMAAACCSFSSFAASCLPVLPCTC